MTNREILNILKTATSWTRVRVVGGIVRITAYRDTHNTRKITTFVFRGGEKTTAESFTLSGPRGGGEWEKMSRVTHNIIGRRDEQPLMAYIADVSHKNYRRNTRRPGRREPAN